jgi:hypothetical protein
LSIVSGNIRFFRKIPGERLACMAGGLKNGRGSEGFRPFFDRLPRRLSREQHYATRAKVEGFCVTFVKSLIFYSVQEK